jgi:hypothetical protein
MEDAGFEGGDEECSVEDGGGKELTIRTFILQSELKEGITLYEFLTALLAPYTRYKGLSSEVYGGPNAVGANKNAWKEPVLCALRPFEFVCSPYLDEQQFPSGVNVNICMSIVHYILIQGLGITKDWNVAAHDNASFVSCTHLRNTSHMSLGLISLLIHTCCEKAMIPANGGLLRLPLPSPNWNSQSETVVEYDSRLHVDTNMHLCGGQSDNVLSISSRLADTQNWRLVVLQHGGCALHYASVLSECSQLPTTVSQLFPFPPEAVAHAADFYKYMALAFKRYIEIKQRHSDVLQENPFALAMLQLGASIRFEEYQHIQPTLTDCVVRDRREIPCVTCEHAFLFTISFSEGRLCLRPVTRTLEWPDAQEDFMSTDTSTPFLPLPTEETVLQSSDFAHLFHHGLTAQANQDKQVDVAVKIDYSDEKRLPFYFFPVMHFPVVLKFHSQGWHLPVPDVYEDFKNSKLLLNTSDFFYSEFQENNDVHLLDPSDAWIQQHCSELLHELQALPPQLRERLSGMEAFFCNDNFQGMWALIADTRVFFQTPEHVRAMAAHDIDIRLFVATHEPTQYYMLWHAAWGLVPVQSANGTDSQRMLATFPYYIDTSEDEKYIAEVEINLRIHRVALCKFIKVSKLGMKLNPRTVALAFGPFRGLLELVFISPFSKFIPLSFKSF